MKGVLETLTDYMYIIVALAIGALMLFFVAKYSGLFGADDRSVVYGDSDMVARKLAEEIEACWDKHRSGLDAESDICAQISVSFKGTLTEWKVTKLIDCKALPNSECLPANCSFCTSQYFDDTNKILWSVKSNETIIEIAYSGDERKIKVRDVK
ncbi:MAG: hypothetical protein ACP5E4_01780 [Candidatus Aenigmatarchaeota archaeon]